MTKKGGRKRRFHGWAKRRVKSKTIPLSYVAALAVPIGGILGGDDQFMGVIKAMETGNVQTMIKESYNVLAYETIGYMPYNGQWHWEILARNIGLTLAALVVHRLARPINAKMKNIPYVGKYVSI